MNRRGLVIVVLTLFVAFAAATGASAATAEFPHKCTIANANGDLPTCTKNSGGGWTATYPGGGFGGGFGGGGTGGGSGIPSGFVALIVVAILGGIGVTIWRVTTVRKMATDAGMDPNTATAVTLFGGEGMDAAYIATTINRTRQNHPVAPTPSTADPHQSSDARLQELQSLRDRGLITPAEYDTRRKAIIDSI